MAEFPRYAIYYAPVQGSALDRFGAGHLGCDAWTGEAIAFPDGTVETFPDWRDITGDPRKYGFHGTLKAPFRLSDGSDEAGLLAACEAFAAEPRAVPIITPVVDAISGFIAVVPAGNSDALHELAAACTSAFDQFRRPMTPEDRARRKPERLTVRQLEYLDRWGYPYVLDEFRFHMTLTGRLSDERREPILTMLRQRFSAIGLETLAIDRLVLFKQGDAGTRFRITCDWPLTAKN